jgi:hypothetical protein
MGRSMHLSIYNNNEERDLLFPFFQLGYQQQHRGNNSSVHNIRLLLYYR